VDTYGQLRITGAEIADWAERLKRALGYAFFVYLSWVSDVIDRHAINAGA